MKHKWAVEWQQANRLDGVTQHWVAKDYRHPADPIYTGCYLALFNTRKEARAWVKEHYGYIAKRLDLQIEPHGWRVPKVFKVRIELIKV